MKLVKGFVLVLTTMIVIGVSWQNITSAQVQTITAPQVPLTTGTLLGKVVRNGSTDPIANASVLATPVSQSTPDSPSEHRATTDASGRFTIRNVPVGQYRVTADREGYFGPNAGLRGGGQSPTIATVTGQLEHEITIALSAGAVISGRVTDANRQPIIGAPVMILKVASQRGVAALQQSDVKTTDDLGEYRHFDVPPGDYYVAVAPPRVGGRGQRAAAAVPAMTIYHPDATDLAQARRITIRGGEELTFVDIQVRDVAGYKISGFVTSTVVSSGPARGARGERGARGQRRGGGIAAPQQVITAVLTLLPHNSTLRNTPSRSSASPVQLVNGQPGAFEILNVPPGIYDLFAQLPDQNGAGAATTPGQAAPPMAFGRAVIDLRSDMDNVNVVVHSGVEVKGLVTVDGVPTRTATEVSLEPIDSAADIQAYRNVSRFRPRIEDNGSFTIPAIPEGRFRFVITPGSLAPAQRGQSPRGLYVADVRNGGLSVYDDGIDIGATSVLSMEIVLATNGGTVEGVTVGSDMQPNRANVVLAPANHRQNPNRYKQTITSPSTGRYTFTNVPPGNYKLFAWDAPSIPYQDSSFLSRFETRGIPITVSGGTRLTAPQIQRIPESEIRQ